MGKEPLQKQSREQQPDSDPANFTLDHVPTAWLNRALLLDAVIILAGLGLCLFMHPFAWRLFGGIVALVCCLDALFTIRILDRRGE